MAKGQTRKPITILVDERLNAWPEWEALRSRGHVIVPVDFTTVVPLLPPGPVVVLGPTCWRMNDTLRKYLDLAVEEGQKVRYPNERGKEKKDETVANSGA